MKDQCDNQSSDQSCGGNSYRSEGNVDSDRSAEVVEDDVERHDVSDSLGRTWAKFSACAEKIGRHGTFRTVRVTLPVSRSTASVDQRELSSEERD
jgi:hypothetical protein